MHACTHACMHACTHACTHARTHAHMHAHTHMTILVLAISDIFYGTDKNLLEALQILRDCVTHHRYKISDLKRLAIEE